MRKLFVILMLMSASIVYGQNMQVLKQQANSGNVEAMFKLGYGFTYPKGKGVGSGFYKNYSEAFHWFFEAAEKGHAKAQSHLGDAYSWGQGVDKNESEAFKWYRKSAYQGDAKGMNGLAGCFYHGEGTKQDLQEALYWYKESAAKGYGYSMYRLANHYNSIEYKNKEEAIFWFKRYLDISYAEKCEDPMVEWAEEDLRKLGVYYHPDSKSSTASTSTPQSTTTTTTITPVRELQPVQEWVPCFMCGGTGLCTGCQGKGKKWYGNSYENCITCHGNMYCQTCFGRKGYYQTVYK